MDAHDIMAQQFEAHRAHLRAVSYRMLGSFSEADDAVQEAWVRLSRTETSAIENLGGWLTTVVARVCLNMLQARATRREDALDAHLPALIVGPAEGGDPVEEALLADEVGLALLVALELLSPAERLAFVLHDVFAVPFDEIAPIVGRSAPAARQLASRARRRVQGAAPPHDRDLSLQRTVVDAFFAAAREGDFAALIAVLDPAVVLRSDRGALPGASGVVRGASAVAAQALMFADPSRLVRPALINGALGVVVTVTGQPVSVMSFTITGGKIAAIDALLDPERLNHLDLAVLDG